MLKSQKQLLAFLIFGSEPRSYDGQLTLNVFILYEFPVGSINVEKPIIGVTIARTTPDKVH